MVCSDYIRWLIQLMRGLLETQPLANGGTLLQVQTIFGCFHRRDVHRLIVVTGKSKLCYARGLCRFMWHIGLASCEEWLSLSENPPIGYTTQVFQGRWPFPHLQWSIIVGTFMN